MAKYVSLINWTDQGIRDFPGTVDRYRAAAQVAARFGGRMTDIWWTIGPYDIVAVSEFADDEAATAFALMLGSAGNIRTTTMRAFSADEMESIIARTR